jgi:hypothetical protein
MPDLAVVNGAADDNRRDDAELRDRGRFLDGYDARASRRRYQRGRET